jgi:tetratricopeptide (TPR) repeat protein
MRFLIAATSAMLLLLPPCHAAEQGVGVVSFENSGAPAAQADFLTGLAQLHNFQYAQAASAFRRAQAADPDFALAYWGEAMTWNHGIWHEQDLASGRATLAKLAPTAEERAAKAGTARERAYLEAVEILYGEGDKHDRDRRYALSMERVHQSYPEDIDATCFYALALLGTSHEGRDVPTYMKAAALMQEVFERHPQHPGAAHYLIHAVDDSVHAPLGLRAAYAYSKIAPDSSHAQHMTAHIFLALGMWDEVVAANEGAIRVSYEAARARDAAAKPAGCGHAITWLEYGYLQQGRFEDAARLVENCGEEMRSRARKADPSMRGAGALDYDNTSAGSFSTMRTRYLVDTGDWSGPIAAAKVNIEGVVAAEFTRDFADAYGAVRFGAIDDAVAAVERAKDSGGRLAGAATAAGMSAESAMGRVPAIEQQQLAGLLLLRQGKADDGLALLREAAASERAIPMEYGPPSLDKPANELLGEVLLELGRPQEACEAFQDAQVLAPGRGQSLIGLSKCARLLKDEYLAASVDARLAKVKLREALALRE